MALTRAMLKGMGLTEEQVSAIIEEHTSVTSALKEDLKKYKADAEELPKVQKELDDLKNGSDDWKDKYEKEHRAFDDYKKDVSAKEKTSKIKSAYKKLLTDNKVGENHIDSILRVTDFNKMELDKDGNLVDADKHSETIKKDWSGFISTTEVKNTNPETPPGGIGGGNAPSRAAQVAMKHYENIYGKKGENK